jgi:hypothetical protein
MQHVLRKSKILKFFNTRIFGTSLATYPLQDALSPVLSGTLGSPHRMPQGPRESSAPLSQTRKGCVRMFCGSCFDFVRVTVTKFTFDGGAKEYFQGAQNTERGLRPLIPRYFIGEYAMEIVQLSRLATAKPQARNHDTAILLGYSMLAIVFLAVMCLASMSPGMAPGDFATMTVFP